MRISSVITICILPTTYLRSFEYAGKYYLLGMPGIIFRGESLTGHFRPRDLSLFEHNMRHAGVQLVGDTLYVFWSRVGDSPERILFSSIDLTPDDWNDWIATEAVDVLASETPWEGSEIEVLSSLRGEMPVATHELRDPYVYTDTDGQTYFLYSGSSEQALGMVKLN